MWCDVYRADNYHFGQTLTSDRKSAPQNTSKRRRKTNSRYKWWRKSPTNRLTAPNMPRCIQRKWCHQTAYWNPIRAQIVNEICLSRIETQAGRSHCFVGQVVIVWLVNAHHKVKTCKYKWQKKTNRRWENYECLHSVGETGNFDFDISIRLEWWTLLSWREENVKENEKLMPNAINSSVKLMQHLLCSTKNCKRSSNRFNSDFCITKNQYCPKHMSVAAIT